MKSSLSQQLSQKGINISIYSPQLLNQLKQNLPNSQSAEKPRHKQNGSIHQNTSCAALDNSANFNQNSQLTNSAILSSSKKTTSQTNLSGTKTPMFNNIQSSFYSGVGNISSSVSNQQSTQFSFSNDVNSLLQKKMLSQQHRRAESTKLAQANQIQNTISNHASSQKKPDNSFTFPESSDDSQINNLPGLTSKLSRQQTEMQQKYYSNAQKGEESINSNIQVISSTINSSRSGAGQTPILAAQIPQNAHYTSPIKLTPSRDPNDGGRFFLNLGKTSQSAKQESSHHLHKSNSLFQDDPVITDFPHAEKNIQASKSSQNSPSNYYKISDNIVPFSSLIQSKQQSNSSISPQKQHKNNKVVICEPKNIFVYEQIKPINHSYLPIPSEQVQNPNLNKNKKNSAQKVSINEGENMINLIQQQQQHDTKINQQNVPYTISSMSPPKIRQNIQAINGANSHQKHQISTLTPPSQEEAKAQFQKILSTLQIQDQKGLLTELTSLYSSIFNQQQNSNDNSNKPEQKQQHQQQQKNNQNSNGNDSTSTSSLDDIHGSQPKNKKTQEEKEREEFLKQEEIVSLEQKVLLVNYIDLSKDELFKLVRDYYTTQTHDPKKYLVLKEQKIPLAELLEVQKWIQEKLLERIDEEKKARLKTEEQTSVMLLNQEKTIKVMESKWQQQIESLRNSSSNITSTNSTLKKNQNSPPSNNSPINNSDSQ